MRSISSSEKPSSSSRSRERASHERLRARAGGHALGADADQPARAGLARHGDAEQRVDLLREDARLGRRLVLRIAGLDVHLGAAGALPVADLLGDVLGERLGAQGGLAEHHLADRVVDDLLEARHVRALLLRAEIDEAVQPRRVELLGAVGLDPDDLLDVRDAHARERDAAALGTCDWTSSRVISDIVFSKASTPECTRRWRPNWTKRHPIRTGQIA